MVQQDGGNILAGSLCTDRPDVEGNHRHTIYDTRILILSDRKRAGLAHLEEAVGSVASHTGHDDPDLVDGHILRDRGKQDVNRRTVAAYLCSCTALNDIVPSGTDHFHLLGARRDQGKPRPDNIAVLRFAHFHGADSVQTLSVHLRKALRHMLCDHHAGDVGGQPL